MWGTGYREELERRRQLYKDGGGADRIATQHRKGKLTARERLAILFDEGTFVETGTLIESRTDDFNMAERRVPGDGVVTGFGLVAGRPACASSEDFTVIGGTLGEYHAQKICRIMDMAYEMRVPYIAINDSGGARIEEGVSALSGYGEIFSRHTKASGVIPQIAVIMGPCAGGACYSPALCDFIFMTERTSRMFITGPGVVKTVIGEEITDEELGGAGTHMQTSGVAHFCYPTDEECLEGVKQLLSYLPQNSAETPPRLTGKARDISAELPEIVSDNQKHIYDVARVIDTFVDEGSFFEIQKEFGKSIAVGFARMDTEVLGIVASQPKYMGGTLDINSSEKAARFVRFCDCFNIPLLTLVDVPGFLPGSGQEHAGIIRRGAKLLYAYTEASVPKVTLILRKAYGGAYISMCCKSLGADLVYAWPIAQIAVMGSEGAVDIIFRKQISQAEDKTDIRDSFIRQYEESFMSPYIAAKRGYVDEVIQPEETRKKLSTAFELLRTKQKQAQGGTSPKKHGNIPL